VDWRHFRIYGATSANVRLQAAQSGTVVQNNRLYGGPSRGIQGSGTYTVAYNLIHGHASDGVFVSDAGTRATLYNNVIYGNGRDGVSVHTTGDVRANVWNNIIDANTLMALRRGTNSQVTDGYNCIRGGIAGVWQQVGNVTADPLLVAPASGDFGLQPTSPCIDAGLDLDQVSDFAGNPIVDMPLVPNTGNAGQYLRAWVDIGAHEQQLPCCEGGGGGCHRAMRD
jgi:hypothetical protein